MGQWEHLGVAEEDEGLVVDAGDLRCQFCGGELGIACMKTVDPNQPFPCACQGTPMEGLCECDYFACFNCGEVASRSPEAGSDTIIVP